MRIVILLCQDVSTESEEVDDYDPKDYMEKGEMESSEKRVTRSMAKEKTQESILGKVTGIIKRVVLGPDEETEEKEKEPGHENDETEENAEATFESIRDNRKPHEITVR